MPSRANLGDRTLRRVIQAILLGACCTFTSIAGADCVVVFSEIMYHPAGPDAATQEAREWVELRNQMTVDIDISRWSLTGGVNYTFPANTIIPAGASVVVAANPAALQAATGYAGAFGPWTGKLDNGGEEISLRNRDDRVMDRVDYGTGGQWPTGPDGSGLSLAKAGNNLDSSSPLSWRASARTGGTPGADNFPLFQPPKITTLIPSNATWVYRADGADLGTAWKETGASEAGWSSGSGAFQLGSAVLPAPAAAQTPLPAGPVTYYFRRTFNYTGQPGYTQLKLRLLVDDGAAVYLNGTEVNRLNLPPGANASTGAVNPVRAAPAWREFAIPAALLQPTGNVLAVELHQAATLPSYPAAVLASGPVAYWRLGENSSDAGTVSDLADVAGAPELGPQTGTLQGFALANLANAGPRPSDLVGGQPLQGFDPSNAAPAFQGNNSGGDDVALFPDDGTLNMALSGNRFTAEAWIKAPSTQEDGAAIFAKGNGGGGEQFAFDIVSGRFRIFVRNSAGAATVFQHPSLSPTNNWQHVALTFDAGTATMRMYVNGADVGGTTPPASLFNNSVDVSVGARRLSTGPYDLNLNGSVDEMALYKRALSSTEIAQHYNAAFTLASGAPDTTDAVFAAELISTETLPSTTPASLVLNEVSASGVEFMNLGPDMTTAGMTLARVTSGGIISTALPVQTLATGALLQISIGLAAGERLVLFAADGVTALDSFEVKNTPMCRYPDGTGAWLHPTALTPGALNNVSLQTAVVINEIMFDPPNAAYFAVGTPRAGQWIELHNTGATAADLAGWRFDDGISFDFPAGATIPAGGYIVVAEDPASVIARHGLSPSQVFGPWSGSLSRSGERLLLEDDSGNPADEVRYASGVRWPEAPNGGGSSLELRDPHGDNSVPESWAASDESSKAQWQTFTWRAANVASQTGEPTNWHELNLLLLDGPGECLIDDVQVTDTTANVNIIQNGTFDAGPSKWRLLGNHQRSRVEPEPGNPGNSVLHLIASGPGEYQGNQIETTFAQNQALVQGREYEVSLRVRWLWGGARLNTRLYFNRLPRTNLLAIVPNGGTPGAPNSRAIANAGPTYARLSHQPVIPPAGAPVTVSAIITDPDGIASATLRYSVGGGAWQSVAMTANASNTYSAVILGQSAGAIVQFYIDSTDLSGATASFPARGVNSRALYMVQDGQATGALRHLRLVMTTADANYMHLPVNTLSNEYLGATVIVDEREVFYDVGARLKGSFVGRNVPRVGFALRFGPDQLFRGVLDKVSVDRSQHTTIGIGEIVAKHVATAAGGIPGMYDDLAHFIHPLGTYTSNAALRLAGFDEVYLDSQFQNGSNGDMAEFEVLRWNTTTVDGNPESFKLPGPNNGFDNLDLQDWGNDKEAYRWNILKVNHRDVDNWDSMIALEKLFSQSGANFVAGANQKLDLESCLRSLAYQSLLGPSDAAYTGGNIHNFRLYVRPNDARAMYLPWDWDSSFQRATNGSLVGAGNLAKVVTSSQDLNRRYNAHLYNLIQTAFNTAYMTRWTQHYGTVGSQDLSGILSYIGSRASFVLGQLPTTTTFSAGAGVVSSNGAVTLSGLAPIGVITIEVNGVLYTPVWSSLTAWSVVVPLNPGQNTLLIRGIDYNGAAVAGASSTVNVDNPYVSGWPTLRITEWLAENDGAFRDPADNDSEDWFEIYNPTASVVDLSGWKLTDDPVSATPFIVPNGWSIPAGGYLLVWADNESAQNTASPTAGSQLHVSFRLSNTGDTIQLSAPDGHVIDSVSFGPQVANRSEGRFPESSVTWGGLTLPTPASPNVRTSLALPVFGVDGISVQFSTTPGIEYALQRSDDLVTWFDVAPPQSATGSEMTVTDATAVGLGRFYRVRVSH
jgi:hypothetical protein